MKLDLVRDPDVVRGFLEDAAHVAGGHADAVAFPRDTAEVAALVAAADHVLPVGAQSSLTGGATPRGGLILSTRALTGIESRRDCVHVGAGVTIAELQRHLAREGRYYPPVPTYDGAFVGGTIATNAAGAATFKYGTTRRWVEGLTLVVADGTVLDLRRGEQDARAAGVPVPTYRMPDVAKHTAGYFSSPDMDLLDLFVGSEGTLGVIVAATLRTIPRPETTVVLIACDGEAEALSTTRTLVEAAPRDVDVAGIEYIDARSLAVLGDEVFARAALKRPRAGQVLLIIHVEGGMERLAEIAGRDAYVAAPGDERGAARLFELREAVPASVNRRVAEAKARVHPDIEKTAADMIVPFARIGDSLAVYREAFERRGLDYAIWGHFSDGNLHPNVIPRSLDDVIKGREAILEMGRRIGEMGGSPLAEHGVGRSAVKQALLRQMCGDDGLEQMRAIKRTLDPTWKLAPGVLFTR